MWRVEKVLDTADKYTMGFFTMSLLYSIKDTYLDSNFRKKNLTKHGRPFCHIKFWHNHPKSYEKL
jgi:hypothetical protein